MIKRSYILLGLIIVLAAFALILSTFIVDEAEQAIITQFGKPMGEPIVTPGVHFKVPFVQTVHFFDKRFLEWDGANQIPTKDKRFIWWTPMPAGGFTIPFSFINDPE